MTWETVPVPTNRSDYHSCFCKPILLISSSPLHSEVCLNSLARLLSYDFRSALDTECQVFYHISSRYVSLKLCNTSQKWWHFKVWLFAVRVLWAAISQDIWAELHCAAAMIARYIKHILLCVVVVVLVFSTFLLCAYPHTPLTRAA